MTGHLYDRTLDAIEEIRIAENQFHFADPNDPDGVDAAIYRLTLAELRLRSLLRFLDSASTTPRDMDRFYALARKSGLRISILPDWRRFHAAE